MNDNDSTPKGDCFVSAPSEVDNKQIVHDAIAFNDDGHDSYKEAIQALPHLTDTAALIVKLEGMKVEGLNYADRHNTIIDTIIKELKP